MKQRTFHVTGWMAAGATIALAAFSARALEPKQTGTGLTSHEFFAPELSLSSANVPLEDVLAQLPNRAAWERFIEARQAVSGERVHVFIDPRSGTATNVVAPFALLPGDGQDNDVTLKSLGARLGRRLTAVDQAAVAEAARGFLIEHAALLGVDPRQFGPVRVGQVTGELWQVSLPQYVDGVPVRDARIGLTISHGNVVLFGTETWGNASLRTQPSLDSGQALDAGFEFVGGRSLADVVTKRPELEIVPFAPPERQAGEAFAGPLGSGYGHRLVWTFQFQRRPEQELWEAMVDARTGEVIALQDKNHYVDKSIVGGVYPLTNTGVCPTPQTCGTMQTGWPMPFADTAFAAPNNFTDSGGIFNYTSGTATTTLTGRYIDVADNCGALSASSATGDINLGGANGQHDCTTPGTGGAGNTPASRSAFYELNRIKELARGWLPANAWLQGVLVANVNINLTCNAFWGGGSVNFYRTGGGCRNTGEIAAVFDHEWGHGMDDNDALGVLSNSSEAYADIASIYRLQASCVGHGFFDTTVTGSCGTTADGTGRNADEDQTAGLHCDLDCSGVRDADWDKHADHTPDTPLNFVCGKCSASSGPCGRQVHCAAAPIRQAAWDLAARDLQGPPFNMTAQTAFITGNKLFYQGSGNIGLWHACTCTTSSDGCGATNGYMQWLAADDDNGNVSDGTPHMTALFNAFNRHGVACATPTAVNSGCAGGPSVKPALSVVPGSSSNLIAWSAVPGAASYWVFRTDGHAGCLFGKAKIAETASLSYTDNDVQPGRNYYYNVVAAGSASACFGPASRCVFAAANP